MAKTFHYLVVALDLSKVTQGKQVSFFLDYDDPTVGGTGKESINTLGRQGWELVHLEPQDVGPSMETRPYLAVFKKEV
jgi:hypothetical protein